MDSLRFKKQSYTNLENSLPVEVFEEFIQGQTNRQTDKVTERVRIRVRQTETDRQTETERTILHVLTVYCRAKLLDRWVCIKLRSGGKGVTVIFPLISCQG